MTNSQTQRCSDEAFLQRYLHEELSETEEAEFNTHLSSCTKCQRALEKTAAEQAVWSSLQQHLAVSSDLDMNTEQDARLQRLMEYLAPTDDPEMLGRLGGYEVCGLIGQGSTGIVLKALEPRLNRYVAIKVMSPIYSSNGAARRRFEREGRAVAAVAHEHVVPVYAVDEFRGLPYIVMQYIPGLSLFQRIERDGQLETCEVARIGLQVARGLAAAHAQGIVHRDVKPANVILENTVDRAMVTDFGLARVADDATMTRSGTIAGTPQYMSPEQARGEPVDPRSDLFSLGGLLYAAATARPPFRAESVIGVIHRVCHSDPHPIREINPNIDLWLVALIDRLMAKAPDQRFQSAEEVAQTLTAELAFAQNPTVAPKPDRNWWPETAKTTSGIPKKRASWRWKTAACLAAVVVGGAAIAQMPWDLTKVLRSGLSHAMLGDIDGTSVDSASASQANSTGGDPQADNAPRSPDNSVSPVAPTQPKRKTDKPKTNSESRTAPSKILPAGKNKPETQVVAESTTDIQATNGQWTTFDADGNDFGANLVQVYEKATSQTLNAKEGTEIRLEVDFGNLVVRQTELEQVRMKFVQQVIAGSEEEANKIAEYQRVTTEASNGSISFSSIVDPAFVERGGLKKLKSVTFGIDLPRGMPIHIATKSGGIIVHGASSDVTAESTDGDIRFASLIEGNVFARSIGGGIDLRHGCSGKADLFATNGNVKVAGVAEGARTRSSGGNIELGACKKNAFAHASGGNVYVQEIDGQVGARAEHGDVLATITTSPQKHCEFNATDGNVSVWLDESVAADLEARGDVLSELDWQPRSEDSNPWSFVRLNGGGAKVSLFSSTGTVTVEQQSDENQTGAKSFGGSGLGGSGLGGSGGGGSKSKLTRQAREKSTGRPRPGAIVPVEVDSEAVMDGYTLYLPQSYDEHEGDYPVLVYLQGSYGVGGEISGVNDWGLPRLIRDEHDLQSERNRLILDRFIVVSPHIQSGQYYDHAQALNEIIQGVLQKFKADPTRIYLTGLSRGGHGSWGLAARMPNRFAAVVPIGGSPDSVENYSNLADTAIWIAHNQGDSSVPHAEVALAAGEIESLTDEKFLRIQDSLPENDDCLQHRFVFTEAISDSHDAWTDVYSSEIFYRWLLTHQRKDAKWETR